MQTYPRFPIPLAQTRHFQGPSDTLRSLVLRHGLLSRTSHTQEVRPLPGVQDALLRLGRFRAHTLQSTEKEISFQGVCRRLPWLMAASPLLSTKTRCVVPEYQPDALSGSTRLAPPEFRGSNRRPLAQPVKAPLRIDSPVALCSSHGTLLHFSLQQAAY